jgi:ATP-binding cassette, subfamily B, bacterial HlyB/CyaB
MKLDINQISATDRSTPTADQATATMAHPSLTRLMTSLAIAPHPELAGLFTLMTMQTGQVLADLAHSNANTQGETGFWLVCEGRLRLLQQTGLQTGIARGASLKVMAAEEYFGVLSPTVQPYRLVGAATGVIAHVSATQLPRLLELAPSLRSAVLQQVQQLEMLRFFKSQTNIGQQQFGLTSEQIAQILPLMKRVKVTADQPLADLAILRSSYCWLGSGTITGSISGADESETTIPIGTGWNGLESSHVTWVATTALQIYVLPEADWANAAEMAPKLLPLLISSNPSTVSPSPDRKQRRDRSHRSARTPVIPTATSSPSASTSGPNAPDEAVIAIGNNVVSFPQPARARMFLPRVLRSTPFISQQSSSDCGIACLAMISQYWGKRYPLHALREMAQVGRSGTTLQSIGATAERLGYHSRPIKASFNRMAEQRDPWIAHWQGEHYIVVYQIKSNSVLIADPAYGKRWIPKHAFLEGWTDYALVLEPTQNLKELEVKEQSLGTFGRMLMTYKGLLIQIVLVSLLIQVLGLVTPLFTQIILDQVVTQKSLPALNLFTIGLIIFSIWQVGLSSVRQFLLDYLSNRMDLTLVSGFISHTLRLPLKFFEDRNVGDIITRIQENTKIQNFLMRQAVSTWLDASMAVVYLGLMFYYNAKLSLMVLALIPPMIFLTLAATPLLKRLSRELFKEEAEQTSQVVEMISGIETIKTMAAEQEVRWRWEDRLVSLLNVRFRAQKLSNGLGTTSGLINSLGGAVLLWFGASLVIQDQLTIGQFVAFNMLIGKVTGPVLAVIGVWDEFQEVLISVERLNDVFSATPEEVPGQPMLVLPPIQGHVRLDNIVFKYDPAQDVPTLQNLNLDVKSGQTIAIVGRSGSGKSTLIKLLQGVYHPTQGRLLIDGHDIRHVSPHSLRSQLGVVSQDCFLFSGTIMDNIRMHSPDYTLEQVVEAAKLAEAHPFIQDLPLGYNTKVGERGANLSGGQRQRIAIARALIGEPNVLILDEATSSLDTESERRFQTNLERISRNRTTFIIAHRLSTVQHADVILVLDRGILVEQGSHAELLKAQGLYYHLAQQQLNL